MAKFPKTRILVGDENRFAELLFLKESSDGTVTIFPKSGYWMFTNNEFSKIEKEHISVHPSWSSATKETNIKNTIVLDGKEITSVAAIENSREKLIWPIYTKCTAELTNDDFLYDYDRQSEIKVVISEKIDLNFPMLFSVFAQRKNSHFAEIENFSLQVLEFTEFVIGIYFTYLLIPTTLSGFRASMSTRPARIKDVSSDDDLDETRAPSFETKHLEKLLYVCCEQAARNQTRIYMQEFLRDPISLPPFIIEFLSDERSTISKNPQVDFHRVKVGYLPWICDLMQIDDSKEFKRALLSVSNKKDFLDYLTNSPDSYKLTENSFKNIEYGEFFSVSK